MHHIAFPWDQFIIFFIYGLAFFTMGITLLLEAGRYPMLVIARVLWPLATFGILHGLHEWLELFELLLIMLIESFIISQGFLKREGKYSFSDMDRIIQFVF